MPAICVGPDNFDRRYLRKSRLAARNTARERD